MKAYVEFEIQEGAYEISCPDALCPGQGVLSLNSDINALVTSEYLERHKRFRLNRGDIYHLLHSLGNDQLTFGFFFSLQKSNWIKIAHGVHVLAVKLYALLDQYPRQVTHKRMQSHH